MASIVIINDFPNAVWYQERIFWAKLSEGGHGGCFDFLLGLRKDEHGGQNYFFILGNYVSGEVMIALNFDLGKDLEKYHEPR